MASKKLKKTLQEPNYKWYIVLEGHRNEFVILLVISKISKPFYIIICHCYSLKEYNFVQ